MPTDSIDQPTPAGATLWYGLPACTQIAARWFAAAAVAMVIASTTGTFTAAVQFAPDPAVQAALADLTATVDAAERDAAWQHIESLDKSDRTGLIRGLVFFTRDAQDTRAGMVGGAVIEKLAIPPRTVVAAIVPMLETDDASLTAQVARTLSQYEDVSAVRPPDFSIYREIIEETDRTKAPLPRGLVAHMMKTHPSTGLVTMARALRLGERDHAALKRLLWADHVINDVIWKHENGFLDPDRVEPDADEQLTMLLKDDAWWVRLYAARIMEKHPAFRTQQRLKRLEGDPDSLVRSVANEISQPAQDSQ